MPSRMKREAGQVVTIEPLSPEAFALFGTVVQNPTKTSFPTPLQSISANQGSATKYPDVSPLVSSYELAKADEPALPKMTMFSCKPRSLRRNAQGQQVFDVNILERHPFTPQTFIPLGIAADDLSAAYLIIVAPTLTVANDEKYGVSKSLSFSNPIAKSTATPKSSGKPDLSNIKAFVARGDQAVTYGAGTWHAPMVVLGMQTIDFVVVQYMNGVTEEDCQEVELYDGSLDVIVEDDLISKRSTSRNKL